MKRKWSDMSFIAANDNSGFFSTVQCSQSSVMINCSQPNAKSLYDALENIFDLNAIRPVVSLKTATNVTVSITLYGILGVVRKAGVNGLPVFYMVKKWKIEYLSWDPVQCGTTWISLPREQLWMPDIVINEFMDEDRSPKIPYVYVNSSGYVSDSRPVRVVSSCNLDIYTFPFDIQNCSLTFNSYTHVGDCTCCICVDYLEPAFPLHLSLSMQIVMRRRPTVYVVNLLIPSCFLITVDLLSSLLPVENVDRSSFKMTLILGYTVFLLIMNDLLPITGNRIPLINVFFSSCLALMVASVLETVFITSILFNSSRFSKVPQWVRRFVLHYLAYLVFPDLTTVANEEVTDQAKILDSCKKKGFQSEDCAVEELKKLGRDLIAIRAQVEEHLAGNEVAEEWSQIGNVIDRLLFGLYLLFLIFSFIIIAAVWVHWHSH
uniref:5-hydroxytryptamine receptor 3A-like n=1 Tax=Scleropages formosus TaxID=113540 RepID=A0A8C9V658_SCLFO